MLLLDGPEPRYQAFWAHDRDGERRAFEDLVDLIHARLAEHPGLHVYHFSGSEPSTLKRLMAEHVTREAQVDDLLRRKVFVDLHTILRQALRAGVPSYSLKDVEALFGFTRSGPVQSGTQAILHYERWLHQREQALLDEIAAYNREDCRATLGLLDWLHRIRPAELPWPEPPEARPLAPEATEALDARQRLREELVDGAERRVSPLAGGRAARVPPARGPPGLVGLLRSARQVAGGAAGGHGGHRLSRRRSRHAARGR